MYLGACEEVDIPLLVPGGLLRELEAGEGLHQMADAPVDEAPLPSAVGVRTICSATANGFLVHQDKCPSERLPEVWGKNDYLVARMRFCEHAGPVRYHLRLGTKTW